jgi:transposase
MIGKEDFAVIQALHQRGVYQKDIAEELNVHPKTVSRAIQRQGAPERERAKRGSKLDVHKGKVDQLLSEDVWNARVILREIQADGYEGGYSILLEYIQPKRVLRPGQATVRFETEPGKQLQSDWGEVLVEMAGQMRKVHFIVNELGYSRRFHFWCTESEDAEHTYEGLIRSFEYFGGVTAEVLVDNQKSAVLEASNNGHPKFNERFVDLALQYGFTPRACKPYRARTKGKDERMVGYIKQNFFVRYRRFESRAHLNQLAEKWLQEEADPRLQGTVKEVVAERFEREKPYLQPLPKVRYDTSYLEYRQAAWDGYIEVRGNRYSVPAALAGQRVKVRIGLEGLLRIYQADQLVASHTLRNRQDGWSTHPEHRAEMWKATISTRPIGQSMQRLPQVEQRSLIVYEEVL